MKKNKKLQNFIFLTSYFSTRLKFLSHDNEVEVEHRQKKRVKRPRKLFCAFRVKIWKLNNQQKDSTTSNSKRKLFNFSFQSEEVINVQNSCYRKFNVKVDDENDEKQNFLGIWCKFTEFWLTRTESQKTFQKLFDLCKWFFLL